MGLGQTWQGTRLYPHKKDEAVIGKKRNGRLLYQPIIRRRRIASSEDIMVAVKSQLKNILYLTYISIFNITLIFFYKKPLYKKVRLKNQQK